MPEIDVDKLLLIVVGAHLRAEAADRPLGYRLQQNMIDWLHQHTATAPSTLAPLLCTDVWYLNHDALQTRPTVSIGGPGVNALSAYLYQKLPVVLAIEDKLVVQMVAELVELRAAVWGTDAAHSAAAVDLFCDKYLSDFLRAVINQVEPDEDS